MRIRYRAAIAVVALISAGAWFFLRPAPPEPSYDGHPLSYWISESTNFYGYTNLEHRQRVSTALIHIGTNALPILSQMLRARDSAFKLKVMELAGRQHVVKFHFVPAEQLNLNACNALFLMGAHAAFAMPLLSEVYTREIGIISNNPGQADQAENLLYSIPMFLSSFGPLASNAVPALALGVSCTNSNWRNAALRALYRINSRPDLTVPAYILGLQVMDSDNALVALDGIQKFGNAAAPAMPAVFALLRSPYPELRKKAWDTIMQLNLKTDPAIAVPALSRALSDPDYRFALQALNAIKLYGPDAKPAVPVIVEFLHRHDENSLVDPNISLRSEIKSVLNQIDPTAARAAGLE